MKGKILTQYATHANTIADTFRAAFTKSKVGGHTACMTAPQDSTKGGLLALQHVTLKPETGMALIVGTVNAGEQRAELRSYAHLSKVNEERFKRPLPFDEEAYKTFLEKADSLLAAFGIETKVTDAPRDTAPSFADAQEAKPSAAGSGTGAGTGKSNALVWVVLALCLAIAGGGAWFALSH